VIELSVDGAPLRAPAGQSIAAALLGAGRISLRESPGGEPRGLYCGIGVCQECRVQVAGLGVVRACVTPVDAGMAVTTGWT
jgi:sarcosine oxidase subunit alpha